MLMLNKSYFNNKSIAVGSEANDENFQFSSFAFYQYHESKASFNIRYTSLSLQFHRCNGGWFTKSYKYMKTGGHLTLASDLPYIANGIKGYFWLIFAFFFIFLL